MIILRSGAKVLKAKIWALFYLLEQHVEEEHELWDFVLLRSLRQEIKHLVDDDLFVQEWRMSRHQQLR